MSPPKFARNCVRQGSALLRSTTYSDAACPTYDIWYISDRSITHRTVVANRATGSLNESTAVICGYCTATQIITLVRDPATRRPHSDRNAQSKIIDALLKCHIPYQ